MPANNSKKSAVLDGYGRPYESVQPGSWNSLPMRIGADGSVLFDFDGHVHADGIDLDLGEAGGAIADRRVQWTKISTGEVHGWVEAFENAAGATFTHLESNDGASGAEAAIQLETNETPNPKTAIVRAIAANGIQDNEPVIIDHLGQSSFLQLFEGVIKRKISYAVAQLNWPGGSPVTTAVNHGLGVVPLVVLATHKDNNSTNIIDVRTINYTNTQFTLQILSSAPPAAGTLDNWAWIAIG